MILRHDSPADFEPCRRARRGPQPEVGGLPAYYRVRLGPGLVTVRLCEATDSENSLQAACGRWQPEWLTAGILMT